MNLTTAQIDRTFFAWWREYGQLPNSIARALQRTRDQIGPPMPKDYVPPPYRVGSRPQPLAEVANGRPDLAFLNWDPSQVTPKPNGDPPLLPYLVPRIVFQQFSRFDCSNAGRPSLSGEDFTNKAFSDLAKSALRAIEGGNRTFVYGSEEKGARKTRLFPNGYVLNHIAVSKFYSIDTQGFAECEEYRLSLSYTWGPYSPTVRINEKDEAKAYNLAPKKVERDYVKMRDQLDPGLQPGG